MTILIRQVAHTLTTGEIVAIYDLYLDGEHFDTYISREQAEDAKRFILAQPRD